MASYRVFSISGTDLQVTTETGKPIEAARTDAKRIVEHRAMIAEVEKSVAEYEAHLAEHPRWCTGCAGGTEL